MTSMVTASIGKAISATTVSRRLHMKGLYARVPRVSVPLPVQSRGTRLKWCREYGNWTVSDWVNAMFTDESRFALEPDDKHVRIWRKQGTCNQPQNITYSEAEALCCQVIYSQLGLAIHQNNHQARRRFVEWAQNEIAVVPDFHKRILFSDEAHFWLNGYVNKQNCRIWSEAHPQVYVETPLHPEKLTVWCALWAGGILQKR
ncbi:HTH_Tnp_Tc3_2 domain-containing protein [Trichonephila clavipes]|nr:HTH_Tnp_Tc3_2 domain-containing protein [Trichonephila clavipes]